MNKVYVTDRDAMPCHMGVVHVYFRLEDTDFEEDEAEDWAATSEASFLKHLKESCPYDSPQVVLVCITDKEAKKYPSAKTILGFKCLAKWRTKGSEGMVTDMIFKV